MDKYHTRGSKLHFKITTSDDGPEPRTADTVHEQTMLRVINLSKQRLRRIGVVNRVPATQR